MGWDSNPNRAKLEKMVCAYYRAGCGEKVEKALARCAKDKLTGMIKEKVFEETVGPIVKETLQELFGEMAGELLLSLIV